MSTYTKRSHKPEDQSKIAEKRQDNAFSRTQQGAVSDGIAATVDCPFPNKPVCHMKVLNSRTQDVLEPHDFNKLNISKQPGGGSSTQEDNPSGIGQTSGGPNPRETSRRHSTKELQMAKEIQVQEQILQEKLWRVGEKIRQKILREIADTAEEDLPNTGQTKTGLYEQQSREPARGRDRMVHERRQGEAKHLRKKQDQRNEEIIRNTHEEERVRWKSAEKEAAQPQRKEYKATRESKEMYGIDGEEDTLRLSQQRASCSAATENHKGAGSKQPKESQLPPAFSHRSGRSEQEEHRVPDNVDTGFQLLPCRFCDRKFASQRLEVHARVCKKLKQSHRQVFNSYFHRTKGSAVEEFWKNHSRTRTPEVRHPQFHRFF